MDFEAWARGAVGRTELEVRQAVLDAGGNVCIREIYGQACNLATSPSTRDGVRVNLVVSDGIVTEITFG